MYQFIVALLSPYTCLLLGALGALFWAWRRDRTRSAGLTIGLSLVALLSVLSTPAIGHLARGSLEWQYPPTSEFPSKADTIVVLAANTHVTNVSRTKLRLGDESLYRCLYAYDLYEQAGGCRIILSGGIVDSSPAGMSAAEAMRDVFLALGVSPDNLTLEAKSSTTYENARNTSKLLLNDDSRIFLVTSAIHMLRAQRCFARCGASTIPAPCNHKAVRFELVPGSFIPSVSGIGGVQLAAHEWLGIGWYWLRGRL